MPKYKRILLKLSGEALAGKRGFGIDSTQIGAIAAELQAVARLGVEVAIVVGGGNFFRGLASSDTGLQRITVDHMGMLATAINAMALEDFLQARGVEARVLSAIELGPMVKRFTPRGALAHLRAGRIVLFAGGTGNPFFSTDTAATLRAVEIKADLVAKATKVDGVYDRDPVRFPDARRYETISYAEVLSGELAVIDAAAVSIAKENNLPIVVFNFHVEGNIGRVAMGEKIGTLIS